MGHSNVVLIAEDHEDEITLYRHTFAKIDFGHHVIVRDGIEVVEYLAGKGMFSNRTEFPFPEWLLMDLKMPRLDGFGVLQWMKEHPECDVVPKVIISNSREPADVRRAYAMGANAYFGKPKDLNGLTYILNLLQQFWSCAERPGIHPSHKCEIP